MKKELNGKEMVKMAKEMAERKALAEAQAQVKAEETASTASASAEPTLPPVGKVLDIKYKRTYDNGEVCQRDFVAEVERNYTDNGVGYTEITINHVNGRYNTFSILTKYIKRFQEHR